MSQHQEHPSVKVIVSGVSGTGKTTLFEKIIRKAMAPAKWVFIYDHKAGDFSRRFKVPAVRFEDELFERMTDTRGGLVVFDPSEMFPGDDAAGFMFFCRLVWNVGKNYDGLKLIVADELDAICDERSKPSELCKILNVGRTFQFDAYFITQSMNGVHNQVRKQFTEIFSFRQGDAVGIDWLAKKGFNARELETLKNGLWKYKNLTTGHTESGGKAFEPKGASRDLRGL